MRQKTIDRTICKTGYTTRIRPPTSYTDPLKLESMKAYGLGTDTSAFEFDHLISLELGGAPSDIRNLWPESHYGPSFSYRKDGLENSLNAKVCNGTISLATAQRRIVNWTHFVKPPLPPSPPPPPPPPPNPAPPVTSLSPTHGPAAGGTVVTITGTDLTGATAVKFGATNGTGVEVVNATTVKAKAPAGTAGTTVDVTVTTPGGTSATGAGDKYTYDAVKCDPAYPTVCIPPPPPDLDCGDITYRNFKVLPPDPHHFDSDGDGVGCET